MKKYDGCGAMPNLIWPNDEPSVKLSCIFTGPEEIAVHVKPVCIRTVLQFICFFLFIFSIDSMFIDGRFKRNKFREKKNVKYDGCELYNIILVFRDIIPRWSAVGGPENPRLAERWLH